MATTAIVLAAVACSTSGNNESGSTTAPTSPPTGAETTTSSTDGPTSTSPGAQLPEVTLGDLESILPDADEVGFGFREVPSSDDEGDPALDAALLDACPEAARFLDDTDDGPVAVRDFEAADGRTMGVELDPSPKNLEADILDDVIDVMNGCGAVTYTASNGADVTLSMSAERNDELGERGVRVRQDIIMKHPSLDEDLEFSAEGWIYLLGPVAVKVNAQDGIGADGTVTPADFEALGDVAAQMESELGSLLEG